MGSILAKIFSLLGLISIIFSFILLVAMMSSGGGGGGFISLAAIFSIIAFGAWLIGNIFGVLAVIFSRGSRDIFTGVILIFISMIHLIPVGYVVIAIFNSPSVGLMDMSIILALLLIGVFYLKTGFNRVRGSYN